MITVRRFKRIEALLIEAGYSELIEWSETVSAPKDADEFAEHTVFVICNSGMANRVAAPISERCISALREGRSAATEFGHPGKRKAIDQIWAWRGPLYAMYLGSTQKLEFLATLPWIGPVTCYHLAKNLGAEFAKPDVHMERLARRDKTTTHKLCAKLAKATGYRVGTIDTVLWRACADRLLDSQAYERDGWKAAFKPGPFRESYI